MSFGMICIIALTIFVSTLVNCVGIFKSLKGIKDLQRHHTPEDICFLIWMVLLTSFGIVFEYLFIVCRLNH